MAGPPKFRVNPGVRLAIAKINLPQNELARRCGITSGYMSQLLSGARLAGPQTRRRLLASLSTLDFDQLFEEVE
jgi:transcriptional regulator with XRE-family HTH domain